MSSPKKILAEPPRHLLSVYLFSLLFAAIVSACSTPPASTTTPELSTPIPVIIASGTLAPTTPPSPTATATFTATPAFTATTAATSTAAASPTLSVGWDQARFNSATNQTGGIAISFIIPNLTTAYDLILGGQKYACQVDEKAPGTLFCWGLAVPPVNSTLTMAFTDPLDGRVVYLGKTVVTSITPPGSWVSQKSTCAAAGQAQTCEMECRIDPTTGQPCIVASCFDMCGPTNFIQTCSNTVDLSSFTMCDTETQAKMKKQYNLP